MKYIDALNCTVTANNTKYDKNVSLTQFLYVNENNNNFEFLLEISINLCYCNLIFFPMHALH